MKPIEKLKLPKKDRPKGLFLYCNSCKRQYSSDRNVKCKCGNLVYRARIHVPGTTYGVKPKVLATQEFNKALQLFYAYKEELKENSFQNIPIKKATAIPVRLIECFAYYMGFLNNVDVPKHKQKERDPKYIAKFDFLFEQYKIALETNGISCRILKFTDVNDDMIGFVHDYFLETLGYSNKTYNNNMGLLSAFTTHIINKFRLEYQNPFLGVPDMIVTPKVTSIRENEFIRLLEIVTPENGVKLQVISSRKNPKKKTLYKSWLKFGYRLGLYTGGRSEDVVELKWTDISVTENGQFDTIKTIDHKIDSANRNRTKNEDRIYKYFAITKELGDLLVEMGYEKYKRTDKYILAPDENLRRSNISDILSKSFSHYYAQLNTGKKITFRNLRKTFMTSALIEFGVASTALTNHKSISMTNKHYYDKQVTRDEAKQNFSVFGKKDHK